jgi:outer membrane protein OmpA-like peptidoglycan-associated protein
MVRAQIGLIATFLSILIGPVRAQINTSLSFVLKGNVFDKHSGAPMQGAEINVTGSNSDKFSAMTNEHGAFAFIGDREHYIAQGIGYDIQVTKECYLQIRDWTSTVGISESTIFIKEYYLQKIMDCGKSRWSPTIEFKQNSTELGDEVDSLLFEVRSVMIENPGIVLQLIGNTDDQENETIGLDRSRAVRDYLIAQGIDPSRLVAISKGQSAPRITVETIDRMVDPKEQESARGLNRRVDFIVLRTDWKP